MSVTFTAYTPDREEIVPEGFIQEWENDELYGRIRKNQNPLELNVDNGNFFRIMETLGFSNPEYCGCFGDGSLQNLQERLEATLGAIKAMPSLDSTVPNVVHKGENGCTFVECGLRDGYFTDRLNTLLSIVKAAIEKGGTVVYG